MLESAAPAVRAESHGPTDSKPTAVHLVTLGCARNEVDSEELAAQLESSGFRLVAEPGHADAVLVNTCGFIDAAKKDSIDTLLAASDLKKAGRAKAVVAVGCLAERYGRELAESLPEADAVLGFDDYAHVADRLRAALAGERHPAHVPRDRRSLLPLAPAERASAVNTVVIPGHQTAQLAGLGPASGPRMFRQRLDDGPYAPLKIASGCDRRCTFCAIPSFRGAYVSRPPAEIIMEATWLVERGVREIFLVSENSSSYGKDLGDIRLLERLLCELSELERLSWIRVSYLQPAEMRPSLIEVMTSTPKVLPYFDLSFQHAAPSVLRRMRRFGDPESFLGLISSIRQLAGATSSAAFPEKPKPILMCFAIFSPRPNWMRSGSSAIRRRRVRKQIGSMDSTRPKKSRPGGHMWQISRTSWSASELPRGSASECRCSSRRLPRRVSSAALLTRGLRSTAMSM